MCNSDSYHGLSVPHDLSVTLSMYYLFHEVTKLHQSVTCTVKVAIDHILGCCDNIRISIPKVCSTNLFDVLQIYMSVMNIHNHNAQATL